MKPSDRAALGNGALRVRLRLRLWLRACPAPVGRDSSGGRGGGGGETHSLFATKDQSAHSPSAERASSSEADTGPSPREPCLGSLMLFELSKG